MAAEEARRVRSSSELSVGDEIEAWHNGKLFHQGRVNQTVASMDLFWIVDSRTGARRLIDVEALVVLRVPAAAETSPCGVSADGTAAAAARTGTRLVSGSAKAAAGTAATASRTGAARVASGSAKAAAGAGAHPASHVPLFQAPDLAR